MAKSNYRYEKRQKELAKKRKKEEKKQRKSSKNEIQPSEELSESPDADESTPD